MGKIEIDLTEHDFERLCERSTLWGNFEGGAGRFENMTPGKRTEDVDCLQWAYAYEAREAWANVILMRAFLASVGQASEILWDMDQESYWVLSNYETSTWREMREREETVRPEA
ncbi:hypothetical protein [Streptomyces anulatus]|uniref:hypothetical protein n=1 Tax=Streptomyces anulatus TaxID=1892 RepID=UPI00341F6E7A